MDYLKLLLEPHLLASVLTLLAVWAVTEPVKRLVRRTTSRRDDWVPQVTAVIIGTVVGGLSWPTDTFVEPWLFGAVLGVAATMLHGWAIAVIRWKWPELAAKLTGNPS